MAYGQNAPSCDPLISLKVVHDCGRSVRFETHLTQNITSDQTQKYYTYVPQYTFKEK